MRVIHINHRDDASTGGALRVAFELVRRLPDHGMDARLLFLYGEPGYFNSRLPEQCDYLHIGSSSRLDQLGRLRRYLNLMQPDIVHFHDDLLWPQLLTLGTRRWKTVIHAHGGGTAQPQPLKTRLLYACQRRYANAVVCITEDAKTSQIGNIGFRPDLLTVIYNGVDTAHYLPAADEQRASAMVRFGLPSKAPVVGFVGRLHDACKGVSDFLRVFAALPDDFYGLVAGTGPDAESLRLQAEILGIAARVRFVGMLDDPSPAYHAMSAFCFTSHFEGFGMTVAEAMACEVPVVGFSCPGGTGEILSSDTGEVIQDRDVQRMAMAVQAACRRDPPWPVRIANARQRLDERFNWDHSVGQLAALYRTLCERPVSE